MKMIVAGIAAVIIGLILLFTAVYNKAHPVDVSATPRLSDEEQIKQVQGPKDCKDANGVPYYQDGRYKACMIKKNVSHQ